MPTMLKCHYIQCLQLRTYESKKIKDGEYIVLKLLDSEDEVFSYVSNMTTDSKLQKWW